MLTLHHAHPWDVSPKEAVAIQRRLRPLLRIEDDCGEVRRVAGVDVGFEQRGTLTRAAVVVLEYPSLQPLESALVREPTRFPYVPGLLSFRELPALLSAIEQLSVLPDLILCDGQGIAHPRRLGIAAHLGLLLNIPTIGVGKTRLIGQHEEPGTEKGAWTPLCDGEEVIGSVLRTRSGVKPLYISPGHRVGFEAARQWVLSCTTRYRLPETTRAAHRLASHGINPVAR